MCRFQHLLSKKWEALRKTAKDVFAPQGPAVGPTAYPSLQRPLRETGGGGGGISPPRGGRNERTQGLHPGTFLAQLRGRAWAPWSESCHGYASGRRAAWPKGTVYMAPLRGSGVPSHRQGHDSDSHAFPARGPRGLTPRRSRHLHRGGPAAGGGGEGGKTVSKQLLESEGSGAAALSQEPASFLLSGLPSSVFGL